MNIKLDGFYGYDEMIEAIRILADAYPDLVEVSSIGTSFEGRDLPLLIISSKEKKHDQKPAYYMQANVHSNEAEGTTVCLYFAQKICSDPQYRDLLNDMAFYIVPRVNPDGAELAVKQKYVVRSRATVHYVKDHIIPKDINGDVNILKMRIRCDDGNMKPHPDDPRYMVPRKSDDTEGPFYKVYTEGIIHDYSGGEFYNPQSTVVDFNRNYPVYWQPNNPLAGKYPLSEQEIKSVADFLLSRPNIFAGIDIHNGSNAVFRPGSLPDDFYDKEDLELMKKVGNAISEATGFPYLVSGYRYETEPLISGYGGTSDEFVHFMLGISFYSMELGNGFNQMGRNTIDMVMTKDFYKNNDKYVLELLKFHDERGTEFFYPWTEFDHPQIGKVEIGGITTANAYGLSFPNDTVPPKAFEGLIRHAMMCPRFVFENMKKEHLEGNLYRITGTLTNKGMLPANGMIASKGRSAKTPVEISLAEPKGGRLVGGMNKTILKSDVKPGEKISFEWFVLSDKESSWIVTARHTKSIGAEATV
jgi:hypothetical protein